jgi:hypothetical protein
MNTCGAWQVAGTTRATPEGPIAAGQAHRHRQRRACQSRIAVPQLCRSLRPPRRRTHVLILVQDLQLRVVDAATGERLRELVLDPSRDYQPTGRPPGPTPKKRHVNPQSLGSHVQDVLRHTWSPPVGIEPTTFSLRGGTTTRHLVSTSNFALAVFAPRPDVPHGLTLLRTTNRTTNASRPAEAARRANTGQARRPDGPGRFETGADGLGSGSSP